MTIFIFDLDGTVTSSETLPAVSEHFKIDAAIDRLTEETVAGNVPFMESFIKRVHILGKLPVDQVRDFMTDIPMYPKILDFIKKNSDKCVIATGNLLCWTEGLLDKAGCEYRCSHCTVTDNKVSKLTSILRKENVVSEFLGKGEKVVFIGEGNNDVEAMRTADVSIAFGGTHEPANSAVDTADYIVYSEEALCRLLEQL